MIALMIAIPTGIVALAVGVGILGTLLGLALLALKLVCVGFVGYGLFRVARYFFGPAPKQAPRLDELPPADRYYQEAMREVDTHIGSQTSR